LTAPSIDGDAASSRSDCVVRVATISGRFGSPRLDEGLAAPRLPAPFAAEVDVFEAAVV
jgi:hypothetical protein